jgi:hypothetical protein
MSRKRQRRPAHKANESLSANPVKSLRPATDQPQLAEKKLAYYSALVGAWIDTRMELDRTLVALSAGGVGLLATLLSTVGVSRKSQLWLYGLAALAFATTLICELVIFKKNSAIIEETIHDLDPKTKLKHLDRVAIVAFGIGIAAVFAVGVLTAFTSLESKMSKEGESTRPLQRPVSGDSLTKSLDGVQNIAPRPAVTPKPETQPVAKPTTTASDTTTKK